MLASCALMKHLLSIYLEHPAIPVMTLPSATMGPLEFEFPSWITVSQTKSPVRASNATSRASVVAWMILSSYMAIPRMSWVFSGPDSCSQIRSPVLPSRAWITLPGLIR